MSYCKLCNKIAHESQTKAVAHAISLKRILHSKLCKVKTYYNKKCKKWHVGRSKLDKMNELFEIIKEGRANGNITKGE